MNLIPMTVRFFVAIIAISAAGPASAALLLIEEDFNGSDATNLTGKTPTTLDGSLSGETWQGPTAASAPFDFERNGEIDANNNTTWVDIGSLINDAKGDSNGIFTVEATFAGAPTTGSWFSLGFYTTPSATSGGNGNLEAGILFRDNGDLEGWSDNDGNIVAGDFAENITTETISVELDLSSWDNNVSNFGTITFTGGSDSETHDLGADFDWGAVGFGTSSGVTGTIESFAFTQVIPEPSSWLLLTGLFALACLRRRRRRG